MNTAVPTAKAKGKARAIDDVAPVNRKRKAPSAPLSSEPAKKPARRGRQHGAPNYNEDDIDALLDACEACLPAGAKSWSAVEVTFAEWAEENERPARSSKSLELKFKQVSHNFITRLDLTSY